MNWAMQSSYKRLGNYIQEVNIRNTSLQDYPLLGVSIQKKFIPSIANTVGTDFTKYKIVKKNQFTYIPDTSRRGDKIGIAMLENEDYGLVSQAYTVFEVIDEKKLLPEYLMMWFRRPEYDRYARYKSHGSVREIFDWAEMCDTLMPIPSPEKQLEIVREYNVIQNRIALNNQLITKLEETAQAIYKQWFVDFEFPDENGKPYKSNGGEMVWCEELEKEIPEGWYYGCLGDLSSQFSGFSFKGEEYSFEEGITVVRGENVTEKRLRWDTHKKWNLKLDSRMKKCFLEADDIVIGMDGSKVGKNWALISKYELPLLLAQRVTSVRANNKIESIYILISMMVLKFEEHVSQVQTGTSVPHISGQQISDFPLLIPNNEILVSFHKKVKILYDKINLNIQMSKKLDEMKDLLLAKMVKVEIEKELV